VPQGSPSQGTQQSQSQRNNQRGGSRGRFKPQQQQLQPPVKKFVGKEEGLGDEFVYHYTDGREATDQYARTTEEIVRYVSTKYKHGADVERSLADGVRLIVVMPPPPVGVGTPPTVPETNMIVWKMRVQLSLQRSSLLDSNMESAYALIKGQCSKPILEKVEAQQNYNTVHQARDAIGLLELIKCVMFNYNSRKYRAMTLIDIMQPNMVSQTRYMSDSEYLEKFRTQLDVLKSAGGEVCLHPGMVLDELERNGSGTPPTVEEQSMASNMARHRFEATLFMAKSYQVKYGRLVQELANDYNKGRDSYPETLSAAYELMLHDVRDQDSRPQSHGNPGMAFNTVGSGATGNISQPNPRPDITCHKCGRAGHFSNKCIETTHTNGTALTVMSEMSDSAMSPVGDSNDDIAMTLLGSVDEMEEGFQFLLDGLTGEAINHLHSQHKGATGQVVPQSWILLDNQSTVDVFSNKALLRNVRQAPNTCRISCNAGVVTTNLIGDLPGYPVPVWYHPEGIANILSLHRVSQHCRVQYDSGGNDAAFHVTRTDGSVRDFIPSMSGLHYCDTEEFQTVLVNTVAEKQKSYTGRAFKMAKLARRIQDVIGRPSTRDYLKIVEGGMLQNCPVSRGDIMAAEDIFGPNLGSLKGKTVRHKNIHVPSLVADVPYEIIRAHRDVTLCFDIMFVNRIAFLVTVSRSIRFGTTERLVSRKSGVVAKALVNVVRFYRQRGFRVKECHGDGEFEALRADVADVHAQLNVTSENEHVPEVERYIRTIKERCRAVYNTVPFKRLPGMMIVEMIHSCNYWLNMFPANDGVSAAQSPRRIMTGQSSDYVLHCRLEFGEYAQVHESHDNTMITRTTGAIALRPSGNSQGGYYFMSLMTGKRLNRYAWTPLPMPGEVIERVHTLARRNPAGGNIVFGCRDGTPIPDIEDDYDDVHDEDYVPSDIESDSDDDGSYAPDPPHPVAGMGIYHDGQQPFHGNADGSGDESDGDGGNDNGDDSNDDSGSGDDNSYYDAADGEVDDENQGENVADEAHGVEVPDEPDGIDVDNMVSEDDSVNLDDDLNEAGVENTGMPVPITGVGSTGVPTTGAGSTGVPTTGVATSGVPMADDMDARYGRRRRSGLRNRREPRSGAAIKEPQSSAHHALNIALGRELSGLEGFSDFEHLALTQYNLKQGLEIYGKAGADAVVSEMRQLHDRKTIRPRYAKDLTLDEKRKALGYLMFIKEKRCGTVKGRGCADGRKQRLYKTKEETSSPTVRTESLLLSCVIDAKERRQVITCDVPGAFMQVDVDEVVHVRLAGPLAVLLAKVDSELYTKYLGTERGKPVMYVQLQKALYGTLSAAMLFWKDLSGHLYAEGFRANPYDSCVMNKVTEGTQCTVLWHVDDLKVSHIHGTVIEGVLRRLNDWYGQETPLTVTRGDIHEYLGMTIDYGTDGKVKIRMDDYVENMLEGLPEDMDGKASTPAAEHLFKVDDKAVKLSVEAAERFHSI
jgi:hypothetical protein